MIRSSTTGSWCLRPPSPNWHHVPFASEAKTGARSGATTATEGREPSRSSYEIDGPSEPSEDASGSDGSSSCRIRRTARSPRRTDAGRGLAEHDRFRAPRVGRLVVAGQLDLNDVELRGVLEVSGFAVALGRAVSTVRRACRRRPARRPIADQGTGCDIDRHPFHALREQQASHHLARPVRASRPRSPAATRRDLYAAGLKGLLSRRRARPASRRRCRREPGTPRAGRRRRSRPRDPR